MDLALNHAGVILFYETYNVRLDKIFLSFSFKYVQIFFIIIKYKNYAQNLYYGYNIMINNFDESYCTT